MGGDWSFTISMVSEVGDGAGGDGDGSGPIYWERNHIREIAGTGGDHEQPIHAEGNPRAVGQTVLEGGEKTFVDRYLWQAPAPSRLEIGFESPTLLRGVDELVIAVGELDAFGEDLETLGQRRVAVAYPGQRGL